MALSTEQMAQVVDVFNKSVVFTIAKYPSVEHRNSLKELLAQITQAIMPTQVLTADGLAELQQLVFANAANRDFILSLVFVFFSRLAGSEQELVDLCEVLVRSVSSAPLKTDVKSAIQATPTEVSSRLITSENALSLLLANKWLVVVLLVQLVVEATPPSPTK